MADIKISQLPAAATPTAADLFVSVVGGVTSQVTREQIHTIQTGEVLAGTGGVVRMSASSISNAMIQVNAEDPAYSATYFPMALKSTGAYIDFLSGVDTMARISKSGNGLSLIGGGFNVRPDAANVTPFYVQGVAAQTADLFQVRTSDAVNKFIVDEAGQVGIGTDTPGNKLHVAGGTIISGRLSMSDDPAEYPGGTLWWNGGTTVLRAATSADSISLQNAALSGPFATFTPTYNYLGRDTGIHKINAAAALDVLGAVRINDALDTDYAEFSHDGTSFNTDFTNTLNWNVYGANTFNFGSGAAASTVMRVGNFDVQAANNTPAIRLFAQLSGVIYATSIGQNGSNLEIGGSTDQGATAATTAYLGLNLIQNLGSYTRYYGPTNIGYAQFQHNDTNFNTTFTNTTNWVISGANINHTGNMTLNGSLDIRGSSVLYLYDATGTIRTQMRQEGSFATVSSNNPVNRLRFSNYASLEVNDATTRLLTTQLADAITTSYNPPPLTMEGSVWFGVTPAELKAVMTQRYTVDVSDTVTHPAGDHALEFNITDLSNPTGKPEQKLFRVFAGGYSGYTTGISIHGAFNDGWGGKILTNYVGHWRFTDQLDKLTGLGALYFGRGHSTGYNQFWYRLSDTGADTYSADIRAHFNGWILVQAGRPEWYYGTGTPRVENPRPGHNGSELFWVQMRTIVEADAYDGATSSSKDNVPLTVRGRADQVANLQEWDLGVSSPRASMDINGVFTSKGLVVTDVIGTDWATFSHDGTEFNTSFVNTTAWNIGVDVNIGGLGSTHRLFFEDSLSGNRMRVAYGSPITNTGYFHLGANAAAPTSTNFSLKLTETGQQLNTGASGNLTFSHNNVVKLSMVTAENRLKLQDGYTLRIQDSLNTDWADFSHNGTDFNTAFTNTDKWSISGMTGGVEVDGFLSVTKPVNPFEAFHLDGKIYDSIRTNRFHGRSDKIFVSVDAVENTTTKGVLFDGEYQSSLQVGTAGGPAVVILLDFEPYGLTGVNGFTYSSGKFYLHHYQGRPPQTLTARVKDRNDVWHACTVAVVGQDAVGDSVFEVTVPGSAFNYVTAVEFTVTPGATLNTWITEIEYHGERMGLVEGGELSRYSLTQDETVSGSWAFAGLTATDGLLAVKSVGNTDTENRRISFQHQDGTQRAYIGHVGASQLNIGNQINGGPMSFTVTDAGGTARSAFYFNPAGGTLFYHGNGTNVAGTLPGGLLINRLSDAVTELRIGEISTLRGNSQGALLTMYGEEAGAIYGASITVGGNNLIFSGAGSNPISSSQWSMGIDILAGNTLYIRDGGAQRWYSPDDTNYLNLSVLDNGIATMAGTDIINLVFTGISGTIDINGGTALRFKDPTNVDSAAFSHDGTDFNTTFTGTTDWNISGGDVKVANKLGVSGGQTADNVGDIGIGVRYLSGLHTGIYVTDNFVASSRKAGISSYHSGIAGEDLDRVPIRAENTANTVSGNASAQAGHAYGAEVDMFAGAVTKGGYFSRLLNVNRANTSALGARGYTNLIYLQDDGTNDTELTNASGFYSHGNFAPPASSTLTNMHDFHAAEWSNPGNGTIVNRYGLYIDFDGTGVTNPWGVYQVASDVPNYFGGQLAIGGGSLTDNTSPVLMGAKWDNAYESGIFVTDNFVFDSGEAGVSVIVSGVGTAGRNAYWSDLTQDYNAGFDGSKGWNFYAQNRMYTGTNRSSMVGARLYAPAGTANTSDNTIFSARTYLQDAGLANTSVANVKNYRSSVQFAVATCALTNLYDFYAMEVANSANGTLTNRYALYIDFSDTAITNPWGVYSPNAVNHLFGGGGFVRIADSVGTDYADFSHDGTDFNTTFTNTTDWNISGLSSLKLENGTANPTDLYVGPTALVGDGANGRLTLLGEQSSAIYGLEFQVSSASATVTGTTNGPATAAATSLFFNALTLHVAQGGDLWVRDAGQIRVYDATDTTFVSITEAQVLLPQVADAVTPTFAFGDGDTGIHEQVDDTLYIDFAGAAYWEWANNRLASLTANGAYIERTAASSTNPVFTFTGDTDTGLGAGIADNVSLIGGGLEALRAEDPADLAAGETSLWLYDNDNGTLEQVTVGAADSGGAGFKVLRIPN